jgi:uncharacterized protein YfeS
MSIQIGLKSKIENLDYPQVFIEAVKQMQTVSAQEPINLIFKFQGFIVYSACIC